MEVRLPWRRRESDAATREVHFELVEKLNNIKIRSSKYLLFKLTMATKIPKLLMLQSVLPSEENIIICSDL